MVTGNDYVVYSSVSPFAIYHQIKDMMAPRWQRSFCLEEEKIPDQRLELFITRDEVQFNRLDEYGYSEDHLGESAILLICEKKHPIDFEIEFRKSVIPEPDFESFPYPSRIILAEIWIYSLVLPGDILTNDFSRFTYQKLITTLRKFSNESIK